MLKKFITGIMAGFIGICLFTNTNMTIDAASQTTDKDSSIIYRTSCEGTNVTGEWEFTYALTARENGNIHIDIQISDYKGAGHSYIKEIGKLSFNDLMIATLEENGAAGLSTYNGDAKVISSFDNTNIIYTVIDSRYRNTESVGSKITYFDFYVKEPYLTTAQTINLFGTEVTIPYGEPPVDKDAQIADLQRQLAEKEAEIEFLNRKIAAFGTGDVDFNGELQINDLVLMNNWLLAKPNASLELWQAGDMTEDGHLDTFDMVLMRRALVAKV